MLSIFVKSVYVIIVIYIKTKKKINDRKVHNRLHWTKYIIKIKLNNKNMQPDTDIQFRLDTVDNKRRVFKLNNSVSRQELIEILACKIGIGIETNSLTDLVIYLDGKNIRDATTARYLDSLDGERRVVTVTWHIRQRGGFIVDVIKLVFSLFKFLLLIPKLIIWLGSLIIWLIRVFIFLLINLGEVLAKDGLIGFIRFITTTLVMLPFRFVGSLLKRAFNSVGNTVLNGLWGVDNVSVSEDDPSDQLDTPCDGRKCYVTPEGTLPFSVIIATILCPPLGIFMEYGLSSWLQILICLLLSLMFYFPGLIYALVMLYC